MTSREIIRRVIHFQDPPRVGMYFARFGLDDTVDVFDFCLRDERGVDPWGNQWTVHPDFPSLGQVKQHPVRTLEDLDRLTSPDPVYYAARVREALGRLTPEQRNKYRFIALSNSIWEIPQYYRGMGQLMEDMIAWPEMVDALATFCTDFWVALLEQLAPEQGEIDAIWMFDDWGTQTASMISPPMWRRFYAPQYRRVIDTAHDLGIDFWLHSCGRVTELIDDFIAVGMDLLNAHQSHTCGYTEVAERFAGRIAFLASVDSQLTLTRGTPEQCRAEAELIAKWGTEHGGLIAAGYGYDSPEANERAVFDYFMETSVLPSGEVGALGETDANWHPTQFLPPE